MKTNHFWQGEWIDDVEFEKRLNSLSHTIADAVLIDWQVEDVIEAADCFSQRLLNDQPLRNLLEAELRSRNEILPSDSIDPILLEIAEFLSARNLSAKVQRELGSTTPFNIRRIRHDRSIFETWAPLGFLVHVAPSNVFSVAALSAIEGLLSGNVNFVKLSRDASLFTQIFFSEFLNSLAGKKLRSFIIVSRLSSQNQLALKTIFSQADGIAAWGGEETITKLRDAALPSTRMIAWGHKLSFAYLTESQFANTDVLKNLANEICLLEQQACSSPQCIYLDTDQKDVLKEFAQNLAQQLSLVSPATPRREPNSSEAAEISMVTQKHEINACLEQGELIVDPNGVWRILIDYRSGLQASPLFRTIWVKPLPRNQIVSTLRPMRGYLQSAGLGASLGEFPSICRSLLSAGVLRIRPIGEMLGSYAGEPHDGEYALARYARRISLEGDQRFAGIASFAQIESAPVKTEDGAKVEIMGKRDFQDMVVSDVASDLFFKSGGSSGEAKISVFTYEDYHRQMRCAADGLYAAGLDPVHDRCMNLFFAGGLYGGFISFFTVLEMLEAKQFPMAAHFDWDFVADTIIKHRVNTLLGMPSYLLQLFEHAGERLAAAGVVKKIFFGGEHFTPAQREYLKSNFQIELIRSASYGSVDAGPLGYQCSHSDGSIHHFHSELQDLEIVKLDTDAPVTTGEVGRLLFSSKVRHGQHLRRYEIGDVGRWVDGVCGCGRLNRRFELLGRQGDVFRAAGSYLNYRKWERALSERLGYSNEIQVTLTKNKLMDQIEVRYHRDSKLSEDSLIATLLDADQDLSELVSKDKSLLINAVAIGTDDFKRTPGSGKLIRIVDRRTI